MIPDKCRVLNVEPCRGKGNLSDWIGQALRQFSGLHASARE